LKIGLMVFLANSRADNSTRSYDSIRAVAQAAEADGFDSIWLADHLMYRYPGEPTRDPAILAKMATAVDEVSHGRLILGVGAGWNEPEYQAFGLPFDHRVDRFEEALQILSPLLRDGRVDFAGKYYQARDCEDAPRGPRPAGPPLMVGGEGPRMLRLTARHADMWNTGYLGQPETLAEPMARIEAACREVGRDPATLGVTALIGLWFPDLQPTRPKFLDNPLTGTAEEIAEAMRGYARLGVPHIMFQCEPYTDESLRRLTAALRLYHDSEQQRLVPEPAVSP
jgi:alkanesulfonate monooxygenase SsuD/methylene tetrahydromethanopterin reductase-like flavin-dependent oxidoreductase (luciferase family)